MFSEVVGKTGRREVLLLTSQEDPHSGDPQNRRRKAMQKAADLHETGVHLDVIPVGTKTFRCCEKKEKKNNVAAKPEILHFSQKFLRRGTRSS